MLLLLIILVSASEVPLAKLEKVTFQGIQDDFYLASGSENDIFAIGSDGNVWHWNGVWWWQITNDRIIEKRIFVKNQTAIYGLSRDQYDILSIYKWDGNTWTILTRNGAVKDDFYFIAENEIYVIGVDDQIYFWNGTSWKRISSGTLGVKDHIQVVSPNAIYGVGTQGLLIKWNGEEWQKVNDIEVKDFFELKSESEIYLIDANNKIGLWKAGNLESIAPDANARRRIYINSSAEIFSLNFDGEIWEWNGEETVSVANSNPVQENSSTYYRAKFFGGILISQPAILAFKDRLVVAGQGREGSLYAREWKPLRMESWDSSRNGQYEGLTDWYTLEGSAVTSPKLSIENGKLYVSVINQDNIVYRKHYLSTGNWTNWEYMGKEDFSPGPFNSNGFTVVPSNHTGYPSEVSLVKFKDFNTGFSKPNWISNLIIYEIATKEFTSPNGPQTGNFKSLTEKMDYLEDLGITAIWLSGHSWSDPLHFGNIFTQYANIHPSLIDPSLGSNSSDIRQTEQELRELVAAAHQRDIKVILDLAVHGVMSYSPLANADYALPEYVTAHPDQSNIMAHPDWFGAITNPSYEEIPADQDFRGVHTRMIDFVGGYEQSDLDDWWINVCASYVTDFDVDGFRLDLGSSRIDLWARIKDKVESEGYKIVLIPEGEPDDYPFDWGVYDFEQVDREWLPFSTLNAHGKPDPAMGIVIADMKDAVQEIFPHLKRQFYTIPISCHDSMTYNLNNSLFEMGYGAFFTPFIPTFISGEEINNTLTPVPNSNGLWLLQSEMQWNELNKSKNLVFFEAVKKAINIRQTEQALHYFSPEGSTPNVVIVDDFSSSLEDLPSPYLRLVPDSTGAILIAGNSNLEEIARVTTNIPLDEANLADYQQFDIIDLWNNKKVTVSLNELSDFSFTIEPDNFRIFKIAPINHFLETATVLAIVIMIILIILSIIVLRRRVRKKITA